MDEPSSTDQHHVMFPRLLLRTTVSQLCYVLIVLITAFFVTISCALLLSQAARTAPNRSFIQNFNAVVIGAAYVILVGHPPRSQAGVVPLSSRSIVVRCSLWCRWRSA